MSTLVGEEILIKGRASAPSTPASNRFKLYFDNVKLALRLLMPDGLVLPFALAPGLSTTGAGTVTVTNASTTVTGSGTAFAAGDVGRGIKLPDGKTYVIATRSSNTSITINANYGGSTLSGQAYTLLDIAKATSAEADWQTPILTNSWTASGPGPRFRKDSLGRVTLRGGAAGGTVDPSTAFAIFRLPVGYRPGVDMYFAVESNGTHGICVIYGDGFVNAFQGSNAEFILDGLSFLAEN